MKEKFKTGDELRTVITLMGYDVPKWDEDFWGTNSVDIFVYDNNGDTWLASLFYVEGNDVAYCLSGDDEIRYAPVSVVASVEPFVAV